MTSTQVVSYTYDRFNRCVAVSDPMGNVISRCYDANNNLSCMRVSGELVDVPGDTDNQQLSETYYKYDSLNRLTSHVDSFFDIITEISIGDGASATTNVYAPQRRACIIN